MNGDQAFKMLIVAIAIALNGFQLYTTGFGLLPEIMQRAVHLGFVLSMVFLLYPTSKKPNRILRVLDYVLVASGIAVMFYIVVNYESIIARGGIPNSTDMVCGVVAILLVLEAGRRSIGKELPVLAILFLLYAVFGPYMPGVFAHRGFSISRLVDHLYMSLEGIFGVALSVSATYLFLFVLFGAMLTEMGATEFFKDLGLSLVGSSVGGPAKVATLSSGLLGMVTGSSPANVAATGSFTIPLMKRVGYEPHFAGAVEAVASTGGQIMPPVMGVAAFIMAEFLGVPYSKVARAAILPAILYYVSLWSQIHYHSLERGLVGVAKGETPSLKSVIVRSGYLLSPIVLIVVMICLGYSPLYSSFFAVVLTFLLSFVRSNTRLTPQRLLRAMVQCAKEVVPISIATAVVGIIIGIVSLTGTALVVGNSIVQLSGGQLIIGLALVMVVSLVLGMGLPTSGVYIIASAFAAPILVKMGLPTLAAHFFVFYYGCLSAITPPVALAAFVGAGIAGAPPSKVGWTAARLGIAGFVVPFMFAYSPVLLLAEGSVLDMVWASITSLLGVTFLGAGLEGFLRTNMGKFERVVCIIGSLLLVKPGIVTDVAGLVLLVGIMVVQSLKKKALSTSTQPCAPSRVQLPR